MSSGCPTHAAGAPPAAGQCRASNLCCGSVTSLALLRGSIGKLVKEVVEARLRQTVQPTRTSVKMLSRSFEINVRTLDNNIQRQQARLPCHGILSSEYERFSQPIKLRVNQKRQRKKRTFNTTRLHRTDIASTASKCERERERGVLQPCSTRRWCWRRALCCAWSVALVGPASCERGSQTLDVCRKTRPRRGHQW